MCLFELWFSQGICPVVGLLGHMVVLLLIFKEISILFSIWDVSIYLPNSRIKGFPFLQPSPVLLVDFFVVDGHSGQCQVKSHCSFNFHFSNSDIEYLLMCLLAICMFSLERCLVRSYTHFFDWIVFLVLNSISYLYIFEINHLLLHLKIFSPIWGLSFHLVCGFLCCAKALKFN